MTETAVAKSQPSPLAWAAYLGASWTWCIGMFLPVLLVRDYGPWAWLIFAVPNCVGAAAMGWVMRSADQSRVYVDRHAAAGLLFGYVTITFQVFFSIWLLPRLLGPAGYVGVLALIQLAFTPVGGDRQMVLGGAAALAASLGLAVFAWFHGALVWPASFQADALDLAGLAAVCLLGFLTCPYLDLTFHRARRSTDADGAKLAFGVGFGVLFGAMAVLTFFYATNFYRLSGLAGVLIGTHLLLQMAYTVNLHAIENRRTSGRLERVGEKAWTGLALAVAVVVGLAGRFGEANGLHYGRFGLGETGYRGFLAFYGLVAPAYVLLAVGGRRVSPAAWAAVTAAGLPFYWVAFLEGRLAWGLGGATATLAAVLVARSIRRPAPAGTSE